MLRARIGGSAWHCPAQRTTVRRRFNFVKELRAVASESEQKRRVERNQNEEKKKESNSNKAREGAITPKEHDFSGILMLLPKLNWQIMGQYVGL